MEEPGGNSLNNKHDSIYPDLNHLNFSVIDLILSELKQQDDLVLDFDVELGYDSFSDVNNFCDFK